MDFSTLKQVLPQLDIRQNQPLAPFTTFNIGGPADIFIHTKSTEEFTQVLKELSVISTASLPEKSDFSLTILGNGSNVLISDKGLRGVVVKNSSESIEVVDTSPIPVDFHHTYTQRQENEPEKYLDFTKLDYDESAQPQVLVKLSSGTSLPYAITYLIDHGITGLQWFAYIPGTIGGATWYNIHGGAYHFSDYLESVDVFNLKTGKTETYFKKDLDWKYEKSFFQTQPNLIIVSTTLRLFRGDSKMAKQVKNAWILQKVKVQPMNSAGSVFANPPLEKCLEIWGEQKSTGWIIDHELNWKGKQVGGAQISLQHSNFIVNASHATARDVADLIKQIQSEVQNRFHLTLEPEINFLGDFS